MKKIYLLLLVFVVASCTKNFEDMNVNTKQPTKVPSETLFTNAQKNLADQVASINVNRNVYKIWAQYCTETTYTDEANYDVVNRTIPDNAFRTLYKDVLMDFKEATKLVNEKSFLPTEASMKVNQLAIIEVLNVYTWQRIVDQWGDVPYSEALDIENTVPKYDDAVTIYKDLFARIDAAISNLDATGNSFGSADLIYGGDVAKWITFANTLKLKLGMSVIDYTGLATEAKAAIEGAVTAGVMTSNADNGGLTYKSATPNTNPVYLDLVASGRHDFVGTSTIIDIMNPMNDPRLQFFYQQRDTSGNGDFVYIGGTYGASNAYDNFSPFGTALEDPTMECVLLDYTETAFYLAEAAQKGFSVGGTANSFYDAGIESSILYWGGTAAEVTAYMAEAEVDWATSSLTDINKIALQAWIASFNRGLLGWSFWRRLDYPALIPPPGVNASNIPVRTIYPINEQTLNGTNYTNASAAIGGDLLTTKLFWDIN